MPYTDPEQYRAYQKAYREKNREKLGEYDRERKKAASLTPEQKQDKRDRWREWYYRNQDREQARYRKSGLAYRKKLRLEVLQAYSGPVPRCVCCGEETLEFLSLDHKNGDGAAHRKTMPPGADNMYRWARRQGYPPIFQVLCHNCNLAKGFYGRCPHGGYIG